MDIVHYRDLINRDPKKTVLSEFFDDREGQDPLGPRIGSSFNDIVKQTSEMKGSAVESPP